MKRLGRKMKISLFLFLGLCSLIVTASAFWILADYHSRHYEELAKAHMEQQYLNCRQRLAVFGEQIRMFGEDAIFTGEVQEHKWSEIGDRMAAFIQSSNMIEKLTVYYKDGAGNLQSYHGNYGQGHDNEMEPERVLQYWETAGRMGKKEIWFMREGASEGQEYFSYLVPIRSEGALIGFLQADITIAAYMKELLGEKSSLWEASFAILSKEASWYSDGWEKTERLGNIPEQEGMFVEGDEIISVNKLTETGDRLVQSILLNTKQLLLPAGITMLLIFLGSLVLIFFGIQLVSGTIMIPLNEMQAKMKNTGNES